MKTLTLDIATHVGFAMVEDGIIAESGSVELASEAELALQRKNGRERTLDLRFTRFRQFVKDKTSQGVTRIIFEDVAFSTSTMQSQLWGSFRAAVWATAQESSVEVFCVHTGTLKNFATGDGSADKMAMGQALAQADPANCILQGTVVLFQGHPADDDEVDAIWLARYSMAVDRGEQRYLSAYQRDCLRQEEKRKKRLEFKAARKARKLAKQDVAKARRQRLQDAIKATGRCCGVWRKLGPGYRAVCPKCGNSLAIRLKASATPITMPTAVQA